jgi:hypothetical protein
LAVIFPEGSGLWGLVIESIGKSMIWLRLFKPHTGRPKAIAARNTIFRSGIDLDMSIENAKVVSRDSNRYCGTVRAITDLVVLNIRINLQQYVFSEFIRKHTSSRAGQFSLILA